MNSPSVQDGEGGIRRASSFFSTNSSMKLCRAAEANTLASTALGNGEATRHEATRLEYQRVMAVSPYPPTRTLPSGSTVATRSSLLLNLTQCVTSSVWPSEYQARTTSWRLSFGLSVALGGNTSRRWMRISLSVGAGAPEAIQSAKRA